MKFSSIAMRHWRETNGISVAEIAKSLRQSTQVIINYEIGILVPSSKTICKIASFIGVHVVALTDLAVRFGFKDLDLLATTTAAQVWVARTILGWTRAQLAKEACVNSGFIASLENGKVSHPRWENIATVASILGISHDSLSFS
jgi:transcriptional regulator with XRE-family HTH domain